MPIESAYRGDLAYIHDAGYGHVARDAAKKLLDELARAGHEGGTIADLGCGSGILSQVLVDAGYRVLGIDVSEAMVALARTRVPAAEFHVGSFVSTALPACVAVAAIGEVLNYGFDSANKASARTDFLGRAYEALAPGGRLLFDIAGLERAAPGGATRTFARGPDWTVLVETTLDRSTDVLTRTITTFRQVGRMYRKREEVHRLQLVDHADVLTSARAVGFEVDVVPTYWAEPLPPGVAAFICAKPV